MLQSQQKGWVLTFDNLNDAHFSWRPFFLAPTQSHWRLLVMLLYPPNVTQMQAIGLKRFSVGLGARIEDIISDKSHGTKERSESGDGDGGRN